MKHHPLQSKLVLFKVNARVATVMQLRVYSLGAKSNHMLCSKIWERDLIEEEIQSLMSAFGDFAKVSCTHNVSIISLICNVAKTSSILERVSLTLLPFPHRPFVLNLIRYHYIST